MGWQQGLGFVLGGPVGAGIGSLFEGLNYVDKNFVSGENAAANREKVGDAWNEAGGNPVSFFANAKRDIDQHVANSRIAYTESGIPYDSSSIDSRVNAEATEYANKRDDEAVKRLFKQYQDLGINPVLALTGGAAEGMSSSNGFRSGYSVNEKDQLNSALKVGAILALLIKAALA